MLAAEAGNVIGAAFPRDIVADARWGKIMQAAGINGDPSGRFSKTIHRVIPVFVNEFQGNIV